MQKNGITYFFIFSCITGIAVYVLQKTKVYLPNFINFYVNDFLIIPIVLTICLFVLQKTKDDKNYKISTYLILYLCGLYALIFEYFLPKFHERYTADIYDVLMYFLGGLVFHLLQKNIAYKKE